MQTPEEQFDEALTIAMGMIADDLKHHTQEQMVDWGWATNEGGRYVLTPLGLSQLAKSDETREVLVHLNVDAPAHLGAKQAGEYAVEYAYFTANRGDRDKFEALIALVDPL